MAMRSLPSGTVTFLFTDVEGSTKLLRELGAEYAQALAEHRRVLRDAVARFGGVEVDTQGDAFFVAFSSARAAIDAAASAQIALAEGRMRVRMGLHTGEPDLTEEGYVGLDVHQGARVAAAAHGGQVVISARTRAGLDERVALTDLGEHRLKDFEDPIRLFQVGDARFPPLKTISNTNLPRPASSFVGRRREVGEVVKHLRDQSRLLTLTGPGGSGKTRLAIESATELVPEFKAGVFWAGLASLREPGLVLETVAQTLGAKADLAGHIGDREILLLLDNAEQVIEAGPAIADLVESCSNLRVLVTSREVLRVRGEVEYAVPPLAEREAVQLFGARTGLDPSDDIVELCARLDDLPLAVELAAARTKVLTPAQILERLSQRLDLFKGGRDADPRQVTLRATIAWSHDLLTPGEKQLFARLAVFSGGNTLAGAEAVCDADLDTLQSLVEKSLVRRTADRFWMLETIRDFAAECLVVSGEAADMEHRHFDHYLELARSANLASDSQGPQRHAVVTKEQDNIRGAMDRAVDRDDVEGAALLAIALENFLIMTNPFEARRRFTSLLQRAAGLSTDLQARLLREVGGAHHMAGDPESGREAFQQSLALFAEIGDEAGVSEAWNRLASSSLALGELGRARDEVEAALAAGDVTDRLRLEAINIGLLGQIEYLEGNRDTGLELLERGARIAEETGFFWWQGVTLAILSEFALELGRFDDAEVWGRRSLGRLRGAGDRQNMVYALAILAWAAAARGHAHRAGVLWGAIESEEARGPVGGWDAERDRYEAAAKRAPGPDFAAGRREGRGLSLDQAVELGLSGP